MRIEVIAVGDEVLRGEYLENNSRFISQRLSEHGLTPWRVGILGDDIDALSNEFAEAVKRSDIIIATGGLGPTVDDITKDALIEAFKLKTEWNDRVLDEIKARLRSYGREMPDSYKDQARVPAGSRIIPNTVGLAVGLDVTISGSRIFLLPGVPAEMKEMFSRYVFPELAGGVEKRRVRIGIIGMTETEVEERIEEFLGDIKEDISIISSPRGIELYMPVEFYEGAGGKGIKGALESYIFSPEGKTLNEVVVEKLIEINKTLAIAESFTGGLIASLIVDIPGASNTFLEGVVTYSNHAKVSELGVERGTLEKYGAVSKEVCVQMAQGARERAGADLAVSTTGIAGPSGGSVEKPVGMCYMGLATEDDVYCLKKIFPGDRQMIRELASHYALDILRLYLFGFTARLEALRVR